MARKVVCGVDGSPSSESVLRVAARLANAYGAQLVVLHAVSAPVAVGLSGGAYVHPLDADAETELEAAQAMLTELVESVGVDADLRTEVGPANALLAAQAEDAELLVVGSRGRGRIASLLLGSVSSTLAAEAPCPVAIVPPEAD